jgi:REP element-mobilizing transposase RayT
VHYFVTIVTAGRFCWFGDVVDGVMGLNILGEAVRSEWLKSPNIRPGVGLGEFIAMPNHIHAIVIIPGKRSGQPGVADAQDSRGWQQPALDRLGRKLVSRDLAALVRGFKGAATTRVNRIRQLDEPGDLWQRNYHEHIVRDLADRRRIGRYIRANPSRWLFDPDNVEGRPDDYERSFWRSFDD